MPNRATRRAIQAKARHTPKPAATPAAKPKPTTAVRSKLGITAQAVITPVDANQPGGPRRFKVAAYTGEPLSLWNYDCPVVIDCSTVDLTVQRIPALYDHMAWEDSIVGQVERVAVEGSAGTPPLVAEGIFTPRANPEPDRRDCARDVLDRADAGYQWQVSIGGDHAVEERVEAGHSVEVNGRTYPGPVIVAKGLVLREISFVVLGADRRTSAVVARRSIKGAAAMTFEEWMTTMGFTAEDIGGMDEIQLSNMQLLWKEKFPEQPTAPDPNAVPAQTTPDGGATVPATTAHARTPAVQAASDDPVARMRQQAAAEEGRINDVRAVAARHGNPTLTVPVGGKPTQVVASTHAISQGWSVRDVELEILRQQRPTNVGRPITGASRTDHQAETMEAAVALSAGVNPKVVASTVAANVREQVMNQAVSSQWRGFGLHAAMDAVITASGRHYQGSRKTDSFIRAALDAERSIRASGGGFTTVSLSGLLGNTANKALLAGYSAVNTTWQEFCGVRSHSDFKAITQYRLDATGAFKKVGPDGELKHVGLSEGSYANQLGTYGAIVALTRQMMINDDLNAFAQIPTFLGRMSALRVEEAVYVLLLSNPSSFFHANNANLLSGGTSVLGIGGLTLLEQKFADQKDSNGKPILTQPAILLVGTALSVTAQQLFKDLTLDVTTTANTPVFNTNPHVGKFRPVVSPYLNNTAIKDQDGAAISGQSATQYYVFADPAVRAAIAVAFLNGTQTPTIESAETEFSTLGMQWRGFHDFGVGMEDPTAAAKSAGA